MKCLTLNLALLLAAGIGGCATEFPRTDATFGKSTAGMIAAQTYDSAASLHPAALAPGLSDGQRIENVLTAHRKDVPEQGSQQVSQTPQFQVGQQQQ